MAPAGNCVYIPTWSQSIKDCKGEFIASQQIPLTFEDPVSGGCLFPEFVLTNKPQNANGYRYIYIDELYNSYWFGRDVANFIEEQGF